MRIAVVGVATEVGKTWVGVELLRRWRAAGLTVAARKPVQSFEPADPSGTTDAELLAAATGEFPHDVCSAHRWYPMPMAPPMAADALGLVPFTAADLLGEVVWPDADICLIETVGGVRSPMTVDTDSAEFAARTGAQRTLLVADAGLGTINAVRLSLTALAGRETIVVLNRYDDTNDLHRRNRSWLTDHDDVPLSASLDETAELLLA